MKKVFLAFALACIASAHCFGGTLIGSISTPNTSVPLKNATVSLTLTQPAVAVGLFSVSTNAVTCYTSSTGALVGIKNPLVGPVVATTSLSGSLTAGVYYTALTYTDVYGGETLISPVTATSLTTTGSLVVAAPALQPANATSYKVYAGTSSAALYLQGTVTDWSSYTIAVALSTVFAAPTDNTAACKLAFSDELIPTGTRYKVNVTTANGAQVAGFPQRWFLLGGAAGTVNVSNGYPVSSGEVIYPFPIVSNPAQNATQSINGPLNLNGYSLLNAVLGPNLSVLELNNQPYADTQTGADAGLKIGTALGTVPATGQNINAYGFEGAQVISQTLTINKPGKVQLGAGTFSLASGAQILITANDVVLEGLGDATLIDAKAETGTTQAIRVTGSRVELRNFKLQGSRSASGAGGNATAIAFISGTRGLIHDVTITKAGSHGVFVQNVSDFHAFRNKITDVGGSCIWTEGDRDGEWTQENLCDLPAQTTVTQAGGIHVKAGTTRTVTDIHILRNRVTNSGSTGIVSNPTSFRAQNVEIIGNTVDITGTRSLAAGIAGEGMALTGDYMRVNNNRVNKSYVQGILLWGAVADSEVLNNIISDSSQDASGGHAAIETVPTTADTSSDGKIKRLIIGNLIAFDDQGGATQLRPVRIQSASGGTYEGNNIIYGVIGLNNINSGIDFSTFAASWLSYGHQLPGATNVFGTPSLAINADTTMTAAPRLTWAGQVTCGVTIGGNCRSSASVTTEKAITLTRFQILSLTPPATCATSFVISIRNQTAATDLTSITFVNGTQVYDSGLISVNVAAAQELFISNTTAVAGCGTNPANIAFSAQYKMQ